MSFWVLSLFWSNASKYGELSSSGGFYETFITNLTKSFKWIIGTWLLPSFKYGSLFGYWSQAALKMGYKFSYPQPYMSPGQITKTLTFSLANVKTLS